MFVPCMLLRTFRVIYFIKILQILQNKVKRIKILVFRFKIVKNISIVQSIFNPSYFQTLLCFDNNIFYDLYNSQNV